MRIAQRIAEDPTMYLRVLPGLFALSFLPLLLIIQFDFANALFYPLATVSILASIALAYLAGSVIGARRNQNRV